MVKNSVVDFVIVVRERTFSLPERITWVELSNKCCNINIKVLFSLILQRFDVQSLSKVR